MTATMQPGPSTQCGRELLRRRNLVVRVWSLSPWLDALAAVLVAVACGGYAGRWPATSPVVLLGLVAASVFVASGWVACIVLLRRLRDVPVPGFSDGFPPRFARSLVRTSLQGLLLAVAALLLGAYTIAVRVDLTWAVTLPAVPVVALGAIRCFQIARPLIHVVLRPHGKMLR